MKIYTKILLTTLPLVILSLLSAIGMTYYFSHNALTDLAETLLKSRLKEAIKNTSERDEILHRYGLESIAPSVKQAQVDAGQEMLSIDIGKQGYIFAVDSQGIIVVHPDDALLGMDVSREIWFREINQNPTGYISYSFRGISHIAMYEFFRPWQWYILATDPESEVYGAIDRMGIYILLLGVLGPILLALALMVMTRRLTAPLRLLETGVKKIGEGGLETRIAVHTRDEFGSLSDVFNKMAKQLQETLTALQNSEKHFRSIIENVSDIITILDGSGDIRYLSPSVEQVLGYRPEDLITKNVFNFIHFDDKPNVINFFNQRIQIPGVAPSIEFRFLCKDGSWCTLESIGNNLLDDSVVKGVILYSRDLSARKQAEETLATEKERLAVTLRSIGDGVITTDVKGKILLINKEAEMLTGWTQAEAIGSPLLEVFHIINEKTHDNCENPVEKVIKTKERAGLDSQTVLIARDGTERIIADSGAPIFDRKSKIIGVVLVFRDISEKRKMEEERLKIQKLESIGLLAGGIAHDFNNILTAFMGNISLSKLYVKPEGKIFERLEEMEKATLRAMDLTGQLLTFSKGGAPVKKTLSISELIKDCAIFALRGSNVQCEFSFSDDLWPSEIDEGQISQVINNMIINADQAMPEGGKIQVCAENMVVDAKRSLPLQPGRYIKMSIQDQGSGIAKERLPRIFDPYFTTKQKGSGLGLATAYSIIDKHDGYIVAESELGVGSTFYIYFPASEKKVSVVKETRIKAFVGKGRILVMDDEALIRDIAGQLLSRIGYDVEFAKDGAEAVKRYQKVMESGKSFDAVIMDLTIPGGMGGKEAVQRLLEIDPEVNAIVSSGYSNDPVMSDFRKFGFKGVVPKPYTIEELGKALQEILTED
ncbi:MAG: PAS domain S-box protein [Deltaproteobacteria bacterium]|nr:PAS domain S-box protein [Deltaproteobacteria bacterium]